MSSSNNAEPKRRTVATTKMNTNGEVSTQVYDMMIAKSKDLGNANTVRGESTPTIAYQRKRKHTSRPETPKWKTVLSIITKLCLLLVGFLWLGQMILKLSNGDGVNYPFAASEYDGRLYEVESFMKKTAKMLQVQLEVVDKKIGSEIGVVSKELSMQIEDKSVIFEKELKKLEERTNNLGMSIDEIKHVGLLTKEEFESFKSELKKRRGLFESDEDVSLVEIAALAKEIVEKEIEKHAADGLGMVDYAVASGGAKVIMHSEPFVSGKTVNWFDVGKDRARVHSNAKKMLQPSFGEPGQCFALQGSSGYVDIKLRTGIIPEAVTLEHVSKSVAYDRSSAPKDCMVYAWSEGSGDPDHTQLLTKFSYDLKKSNAQTFNVEASDVKVINMVRFEFASNHGNPALTCIYRFRVHGYEPNPSVESKAAVIRRE